MATRRRRRRLNDRAEGVSDMDLNEASARAAHLEPQRSVGAVTVCQRPARLGGSFGSLADNESSERSKGHPLAEPARDKL